MGVTGMSVNRLIIEGWEVDFSGLSDQSLVDRARAALEEHLKWVRARIARIGDAVHSEAIHIVTRRSPIKLSETSCPDWMVYHWGPPHGVGIEVYQTKSLLDDLAISGEPQPPKWNGYFIHELGHSFHQHYLCKRGENDKLKLKELYEDAQENPAYIQSIDTVRGRCGPHYALQKESTLEYFACLFCAYFDASDWSPENRAALAEHDPDGLAFIDRLILDCVESCDRKI